MSSSGLVTEKMLGYALGRAIQSDDRPSFVPSSAMPPRRHYRWSAVIAGIVKRCRFRCGKPPRHTAAETENHDSERRSRSHGGRCAAGLRRGAGLRSGARRRRFPLVAKTAAHAVGELGVVYLPNGMAMQYWTPRTVGARLRDHTVMQPLADIASGWSSSPD